MTFHATFDVKGIPKAAPRKQAFAKAITKAGKPVLDAKGRPKVMARVHQKNTAEWWKSQVVIAGKDWRPANPLEGPIQIRIIFWMPRPKRLLRKKDPDGPVLHTFTPDKDNLEKPVMDALTNDGWFQDDAQICMGKTVKCYHAKTGSPGAEIYIDELDDELEDLVARAIESVRMPI